MFFKKNDVLTSSAISVNETVQKGRKIRIMIIDIVMPDPDPAFPALIKERSSRIEYGMTPFLDSLLNKTSSDN